MTQNMMNLVDMKERIVDTLLSHLSMSTSFKVSNENGSVFVERTGDLLKFRDEDEEETGQDLKEHLTAVVWACRETVRIDHDIPDDQQMKSDLQAIRFDTIERVRPNRFRIPVFIINE